MDAYGPGRARVGSGGRVSSTLAATAVNVAENVGFWIIGAIMIVAAVRVVTTRNVVHAALWLVVVLGGVAAQYILGAAEFVAVSQIMVYIGAVMVLFLFGIMLTRAKIGTEKDLNNPMWGVGVPVALLLFGVLAYGVFDVYRDSVTRDPERLVTSTDMSDFYLNQGLISFFAVSFVLLAAAIGAIVLARRD